jgi:hypothetical protein
MCVFAVLMRTSEAPVLGGQNRRLKLTAQTDDFSEIAESTPPAPRANAPRASRTFPGSRRPATIISPAWLGDVLVKAGGRPYLPMKGESYVIFEGWSAR